MNRRAPSIHNPIISQLRRRESEAECEHHLLRKREKINSLTVKVRLFASSSWHWLACAHHARQAIGAQISRPITTELASPQMGKLFNLRS
jgi:hypothetical protein